MYRQNKIGREHGICLSILSAIEPSFSRENLRDHFQDGSREFNELPILPPELCDSNQGEGSPLCRMRRIGRRAGGKEEASNEEGVISKEIIKRLAEGDSGHSPAGVLPST